MTDSEKPFICSSAGCNMSFTSEDHLSVHKKKHDMVLNLGSNGKNNTFLADQTPTPTRFIRNCEEVGLFQDLQNVNPFEETFRRAVEAGNTGTLTVPEGGITDDTLHTPHIFPHIADVLSANSQILDESNVEAASSTISVTEKSSEEKNLGDTNICTNVKLNATSTQGLIKDVKLSTSKDETLLQERIIEHSTTTETGKILASQHSPQLSINGEEVQLLLKTADGKLMQLTATPLCDALNSCNAPQQIKQQMVVIKTEPSLKCGIESEPKRQISRLSLAKMKLKQVLTKNAGAQNQKLTEKEDASKKENRNRSVDQSKKKEILERNRASSMRARAKRKAWIQQLERTVTNVNEANVALQMEVKALRAEVAKLKTLLLAHKDCPVTKAMQKGNGIILGPKIISVNPEVINVPASSISATKRTVSMTSETSSQPTKKLSLTTAKNPVIFPKVDCNIMPVAQNTTIVKNVQTLKIMGVSQLVADKEDTRQILIVQNTPRKLIERSPRQIIQINPNYEMDHVASRSNGT